MQVLLPDTGTNRRAGTKPVCRYKTGAQKKTRLADCANKLEYYGTIKRKTKAVA